VGGRGDGGGGERPALCSCFRSKGKRKKKAQTHFPLPPPSGSNKRESRVREGEAQWLALKDSGWGGNTKRGWRDGKGGWRSGGAAHLLGRFGVPLPQFPPKLLPYRPLFYRAVTVACMRQQQAQQTSRITRRIRRSFGLLSFLFYFPLEGGGVFHAAAAAAR